MALCGCDGFRCSWICRWKFPAGEDLQLNTGEDLGTLRVEVGVHTVSVNDAPVSMRAEKGEAGALRTGNFYRTDRGRGTHGRESRREWSPGVRLGWEGRGRSQVSVSRAVPAGLQTR